MKTNDALAPCDVENQTHFGYRRVDVQEKVRLVQDHFNLMAARYDLSNTILSLGCQIGWKKKAVAALNLCPGEWVIDICGGTGDLTLRAAQKVGSRGRVALYDFNRAMLDMGIGKVKRSPFGESISFIQGDAEWVSLAGGRFDAAMAGFGIRNLAHPVKGLQEIYRVLKPGGRFMCLEFSRPTAAWFGRLYDFYSFAVMPLAGGLLVGSRRAYTYLAESIRMFPEPDVFFRVIEETGFTRVRYRPLTGGIATLYTAVKPWEEDSDHS